MPGAKPASAGSAAIPATKQRRHLTQIGELLIATVITKLQVPVMYAIFVLDLKI